uniref:Ig-like domain-containing protein n=1 Tax=Sphaeramia orbicularis TaxID=375764 RepID=A0A672ZAY9_9TELE
HTNTTHDIFSIHVTNLLHLYTLPFSVFGTPQPIVIALGDDVVLPCHLEPAQDAEGFTLKWTRPDLKPRFVHVWRAGVELQDKQHPQYQGRTALFTDELKHGNISLKLVKVKPADEGTYRCYIPALEQQSFVQVVVGAASSPVIKLVGFGKPSGSVVLECTSSGWYPEPEVSWMDSEGHLVSAGPPETVRGPDDLYTVSSRVTVDKRHGSTVTCRVHQDRTNQTREAHIQVPGKSFSCWFGCGHCINKWKWKSCN